jgi:hypothetical protein
MCKLLQGLSIVFKHIKNTLAGNMGLSMVFKHIKNALAGNVVKLFRGTIPNTRPGFISRNKWSRIAKTPSSLIAKLRL